MNSNLFPSALHSPHYSRRSKACSLTRSTLSSPLPSLTSLQQTKQCVLSLSHTINTLLHSAFTHLTTADEAMRALVLFALSSHMQTPAGSW